MTGMAKIRRAAMATIQAACQPAAAAMRAKETGSSASPSWWPGTTSEVARPRPAANQRPVSVSAVWVIMPWPKRRNR